MPATCIVFMPAEKGGSTWTPQDPDPSKRLPAQVNTNTKVYEGPCRVVQNTGFRARKGQDAGQNVVDQAVTIQLSLNGNTLGGFDSPDSWLPIYPGCLVTVTNVASIEGRKQSNAVGSMDYYVRLVNEASSRMTKDLVCDVVANARGAPRGNIG